MTSLSHFVTYHCFLVKEFRRMQFAAEKPSCFGLGIENLVSHEPSGSTFAQVRIRNGVTMNIKGLLLGSAAALAAVSGAHAADAIVAAEPEPLEYVRICDAYGAGYFYIPGTETCLKVGGMVRTEGGWYNAYNPGPGGNRGTYWHTRAQLSIDTASDTEYGALKTDTVYRFDWNDGNPATPNLLWANLSLGGLPTGQKDSHYILYPGYAGNVINDDVIYDGPYELNQLTYNYDAGNGFTAVISLEDTNSGPNATGANGEDSSDHYAPDVVAGVGYKAGAWS